MATLEAPPASIHSALETKTPPVRLDPDAAAALDSLVNRLVEYNIAPTHEGRPMPRVSRLREPETSQDFTAARIGNMLKHATRIMTENSPADAQHAMLRFCGDRRDIAETMTGGLNQLHMIITEKIMERARLDGSDADFSPDTGNMWRAVQHAVEQYASTLRSSEPDIPLR